MNRKLLLNALLFQTGWFACVFAARQPWLLAVAALALLAHFRWVGRWAAEGRLVASVLIAGSALDSFLLQLGVFDFGAERLLVPLWLALLWALLATTLNHCLAWTARPWNPSGVRATTPSPATTTPGSGLRPFTRSIAASW